MAREKKARFLLASTSESYGDPLVHPQPESYWGNVNPVGPRGVYDEAETLLRSLDDGLPKVSWGQHGNCPHFQYLRSADASRGWPSYPELRPAGISLASLSPLLVMAARPGRYAMSMTSSKGSFDSCTRTWLDP